VRSALADLGGVLETGWPGIARVRTAIVSNAWPHARVRLAADGLTDQADEIVRSCEAFNAAV
jgi:FMN phosphatase YigB (HAD superfamily)